MVCPFTVKYLCFFIYFVRIRGENHFVTNCWIFVCFRWFICWGLLWLVLKDSQKLFLVDIACSSLSFR